MPCGRDDDGGNVMLLDGIVEAQDLLHDRNQEGQSLSRPRHGLDNNVFVPKGQGYGAGLDRRHSGKAHA